MFLLIEQAGGWCFSWLPFFFFPDHFPSSVSRSFFQECLVDSILINSLCKNLALILVYSDALGMLDPRQPCKAFLFEQCSLPCCLHYYPPCSFKKSLENTEQVLLLFPSVFVILMSHWNMAAMAQRLLL